MAVVSDQPSVTAGPLVSTVVPTYNRRALIERALDSALAQTHLPQEIIVVDDGSTDGTAELLRERYGDRLRYVAQPNAGVSCARNTGMRLARGEFIALLDSDDEWGPTKLTKQVAFMRAHPDYGMVLTDVRRVDGERREIDVYRRRDVIRTDGAVLQYVLRDPAFVPASALFRRDVFERLGGFDESLRTAEDIDFHLRVAAAFKIGVIEEALTIAMRGHGGLSNDDASDGDYVRVLERFVRAQADQIPSTARHAALFRTYVRNARSALASGRYAEALRLAMRAGVHVRSWSDVAYAFRAALYACRVGAARTARALNLRGQ